MSALRLCLHDQQELSEVPLEDFKGALMPKTKWVTSKPVTHRILVVIGGLEPPTPAL
jgi:hypothetical protein